MFFNSILTDHEGNGIESIRNIQRKLGRGKSELRNSSFASLTKEVTMEINIPIKLKTTINEKIRRII